MSDIIDINVGETIEEVTINVVDNLITVNINKVTGGGGSQTLAETLDLGNTTGGENISISNGDAIILDNGSMLKKGTIDAGNGGSGGISQICGVGFEHKWEAGRLYIMNDGGTTIREVSHNLTYTPTATDDVTKGFVQNTRWILDNGDVYVCTDPTEGAAVWEFITGAVPTLQQVTYEGNTTTNDIEVENANYFSIIQPSDVGTENKNTGAYAYIGADGVLGLNNGDIESTLKNTNVVNAVTLEFPDKPTGTYTIATTEDVTTPTLQEVTDVGNETSNHIKVIDDGNTLTELRHYGLYFEDLVNNGTTILAFSQTSTSDQEIEIRGEAGTMALLSDIPAAQVNSDWNATSGVAEILNKPTIPTNTSDLTNDGSDGVNPFITALDIPTTGQASTLVREVKNMTGATLTKGTVVYISGANGNKPLVSKALATTDALSSRTFGLLQSNISNNGLGYCVIIGDLSGLDTSTFAEGDQLYLSGVTAGTYTATKILAPTHLVYVGKVTRSHPTQGQIEVGIQNGYELSEIHDVALSSEANNQALVYETSTDLWKNKTIIQDSITDGVTTVAPSQNAVFDALALKFDSSSYEWMQSQGFQALGSSIKGINLASPSGTYTANTPLTSGQLRLIPYYLSRTSIITGAKFFQVSQGVYTGNNYNGIGLYSYSNGTLTLVASTTNDTEFWKGSGNTWITKAFSSTYSAAIGVYYIGILYSQSAQTTAPAMSVTTSTTNSLYQTIDFTNGAKISATLNTQTSLPTPFNISTTSLNTLNILINLY